MFVDPRPQALSTDFKTHNGRPPDSITPRQYAVVPSATPFSGGCYRAGSDGLSYAQHEALRQRKTPHGNVYEQDSGGFDSSVQIPASKHVLLSLSPPSATRFQDASRHGSTPPLHGMGSWPLFNTNASRTHTNQQTYPPAWDFPGAPIDSILNQSMPTQRYYLQPGSRVPTVMPAQLQNYFGPTASAGQEYFGPYWPDGQYVPYRPASIRDDRYYDQRPQSYAHYASQDPSAAPAVLRRPGKFPADFQQHNAPPTWPQIQHSAASTGYDTFSRQSHVGNYATYSPVQQTRGYQPSPYPAELDLDQSLYPTPEAESLAFREKSFSWAHRIYGDLLVVHQKCAMEMHSAGSANGARKGPPKVTMFPKPPKPRTPHSSDIGVGRSASQSAAQSLHYASDNVLHQTPSRPQTAIFSPHRRASESANPLPPALGNDSFSFGHMPIKRDIRRISDSSISHAGSLDQAHVIRQTAASALQTMELLCDQAEVQWVDGMLLVGCLAYGLGQYEKALKWYQAILAQDQKHVEAMSNLAATLFALNRRDEALNYWNAAIQLRPSYFEAVEHLIGLLCSARRAKEAIDLIEFVEARLKIPNDPFEGGLGNGDDSDATSNTSLATMSTITSVDSAQHDYDSDRAEYRSSNSPGFGSSGYSIPGSENGRMLALIHTKGNMLYTLGKNSEAAVAFESAVLIATGHRKSGIRGLIHQILYACLKSLVNEVDLQAKMQSKDPVLLAPSQAEATARNLFPPSGQLPGLAWIVQQRAIMGGVSTTSNSLLSLAKIYQDAMSNSTEVGSLRTTSTKDILALYYLSLSLQRSPSTANNVGILLAGVQHSAFVPRMPDDANPGPSFPGVSPGSGISLALSYYNYGLNLDKNHAHLYTNLGSLLKDIGQLGVAIKMYEHAVGCDPKFDIALANLANAVKDQGRVADAIGYYKRAVASNPNFAEAVCGLATALNSVCNWQGRGGVFADDGARDRVHVDENGRPSDATRSYGWMNQVVEIVEKQLKEGGSWGMGTLSPTVINILCQELTTHLMSNGARGNLDTALRASLRSWSGKPWEGSRIVRLVERAIRRIGWQWYQDRYKEGKEYPKQRYTRPTLPLALSSPTAPTVLPFHTFTTPLSAKGVRQISQRNAQRISVSTLRSAWLPKTVYPPPPPPRPHLNVGYVSSDFNNHPLAHLMQSIFGFHDQKSVRAICYATTPSDNSDFRAQIEREAPVFRDVSTWSTERLVKQIVDDHIHILVNLNGYTRGARNEVFAARPAPLHMSFMGFAGTLGAEWCDYIFADEISVPASTLSRWRRNVAIEDKLHPDALAEDDEDWVYNENIIFARETFFCVDHKQSAPDADCRPAKHISQSQKDELWRQELKRRWKLRKEIFPTNVSDDAVIFGNFNQLYKIDPATFRMYLRILSLVPNSVLWLLKFPDLGEQHLKAYAEQWAGSDVARRVIFTDVASKGMHITRASVVDLFLDTPECNAHTTAADVVWSGTPILTWSRWSHKLCSRMAGSILSSALPETEEGKTAQKELTVNVPWKGEVIAREVDRKLSGEDGEREYIEKAVRLGKGMQYWNAEARQFVPDVHKSGGTASMVSTTSPSKTDARPSKRIRLSPAATLTDRTAASNSEEETPFTGLARGRLTEIRRMLWEHRWESRLFDTKRWVRDLERAYWVAWEKWVAGEGGDIWL
ncbi:putative UDP-N-acetylglucosamine--peptide N-acetylglucosaminyltransferase SEC [Cyphellophora attinorum]|uniref:protein O-GlcNAc transferase n=1 Tax=Cyphellophora attinorum TaxID=1664694 RepID=A0A0N1P2D9_9EURO|nr:putative UDP-N-acetylglucosamine--peptide N-acetylglucosaminyltransferase SEC [Phialophora attinorum]KPI43573.1 putative UDP-N-acetylglucosamine--peptide N-acetylglucosaminyltransferase SEC [Phialophora attinorum]